MKEGRLAHVPVATTSAPHPAEIRPRSSRYWAFKRPSEAPFGTEIIVMWIDSRGSLFSRLFVLVGQSVLLSFFLFLTGLPTYGQSGAITLVQHASKDAGNSTSSTLSFGANNTSGNWIAVCVRAGALNEVITVGDTRGDVYRKAIQFNQTTDGFTGAIFYAESIAGGANTVTVSDNISGTLRFSILEYSGVATSASLDVAAAAQDSSNARSSAPVV